MADEFPRAEVIGIDLAPLQPRCTNSIHGRSLDLISCSEPFPQIARKCIPFYKGLFSKVPCFSYSFELCDLETGIPYPDGYFDLVHARSMHIGVNSNAT